MGNGYPLPYARILQPMQGAYHQIGLVFGGGSSSRGHCRA